MTLCVIGGMRASLILNHADRAQRRRALPSLCNVIAPIMTEPGGTAWRQTIFHPFAQAARWAHGDVLRSVVKSPGYANAKHGELPYLCASVVDDGATGQTAVFLLNRSLTDEMDLSITLRGLGLDRELVQAEQLHSADINAANTADAPDRVAPQALSGIAIEGEQLRVKLLPASWNVIVTKAVRA